jgi:hypothetical protein
VYPKQIIVETRRREEVNGAWKPDARWTQGPDRDPLPRYSIKLPDKGKSNDKKYSATALGDKEAQEDTAHAASQSMAVKNGDEGTGTNSTPKSKNPISPRSQSAKIYKNIENFGIQPHNNQNSSPRSPNRTTFTPSSKSKTSLSVAEDLTKTIRMEIITILKDPKLKSLVEQISLIYKNQYGVNIATVADMASKLVSSDVCDVQLLLLTARHKTISVLESAGKTKDDLEWLRQRVLKIVGWQILLAVNRDYISKNSNLLNPTGFSGAIWLPVRMDSSIEVIHATLHSQCAEFELIEMKNEQEKLGKKVVGKTRMDDEIIPENGPLADIEADEIIESLYEHLTIPTQKLPKEEMIVAIKAALRARRAENQASYLVVRVSERGNPLNDRQVIEALFNDLGDDLRIIFHDANTLEKDIFYVSEIAFNQYLKTFLDIE